MTLQEIAKKHGVTHQCVAMAVCKYNISYFRPVTQKQCIYPNIRKWMNDNKVSQAEIIRRMGVEVGGGTSTKFRAWLRGENEPRKRDIDMLLKITGMTYEEMFREEETE